MLGHVGRQKARRRIMSARKDEELTRAAFDSFLRRRGCERPEWKDGEDPPDFYMTMANERYAVEVTSVHDIETVGARRFTTIQVFSELGRCGERLRELVPAKIPVRGAYVVNLEPVTNLKDVEATVTKGIIRYLEETADEETAPVVDLYRDPPNRWTIEKMHNKKDYITFPISLLPGAKWEGEMLQDLEALVGQCISNKIEKLRRVSEEKILLILDRYHYATLDIWRRATNSLNFEGWYMVAAILASNRVVLLHSQAET